MLNNIICLLILLLLAVFFARKKFAAALFMALVYIYTAPLLEVKGRSINHTYLLTLVLALLWFLFYLGQRSLLSKDFTSKIVRLYLLCMAVLLLAYTAGYWINGTAGRSSFVVAMAGEVNVILLVLFLYLFLLRLHSKMLLKSSGAAFAVIFLINLGLALWQKLDLVSAYRLMDLFYVSDNRFKPLFVVWQAGAFDRIMGTFSTPILLGVTFLLLSALLLAYFVCFPQKAGQRRHFLLLVPLILLTTGGIFAFSKLFMLGLPILFLLALPGIFLFCPVRQQALKRWVVALVVVAGVYILIYYLLPPSFVNIRRYYYGYLLKPFGGLQSRYADLGNASAVVAAENPAEEVGIVASAFQYFLKHPVIGVGPLPVAGEFLGDSQLVMTLHSGGLIGAAAYLVFYIRIFVDGLRRRFLPPLLLIAGLAMSCLASVALTVPETLFFTALLMRQFGEKEFGIEVSNRLKCQKIHSPKSSIN